MSVRLVLLGFLRERPLYGYQIKQIVKEHMGDWTSIAFGSIYFALDKLAEDHLVEKVGDERKGRRPSRSVYRISESGRSEFLRLLREEWQQLERQLFDIDICLFFIEVLPLPEVRAYLAARVEALQATVDQIQAHEAEQLSQAEVPRIASAIFEHSVVHARAELDWTSGLLQKLEKGGWKPSFFFARFMSGWPG